MEGTVSSDETSVLPNFTRNISRPTKGLRNTFHSAKIKIKKGEKPFSQETLQKKKGKSTTTKKRQMYTQILSKNELVINAEEEEEGRERKQTKNKWTW